MTYSPWTCGRHGTASSPTPLDRLASVRNEHEVVALEASVEELAATVGDFDAFYVQLLDIGRDRGPPGR